MPVWSVSQVQRLIRIGMRQNIKFIAFLTS